MPEAPSTARAFLKSLPRRPGVYRMLGEDGEDRCTSARRGNLKNRVTSYFRGRRTPTARRRCSAQVAQHRGHGDGVGHRGAAARVQPDQAPPAALQRHAAGRQELSVHPPLDARVSRGIVVLSRLAQAAGPLLRPVPECAARRARRCCCCRSCFACARARTRSSRTARGRACSTRSTAARHLASGSSRRSTMRRTSRTRSRCSKGATRDVIDDLAQRMEDAAEQLEFERAARLRDQISMLKQIQSTQVGHAHGATRTSTRSRIAAQGGEYCVSVVFVRGGRNLGSIELLPEGRPRRRARGARGVPGAVLPRARRARRDPHRPHDRGRDAARAGRCSERAGHPVQHPQQRARHARALARRWRATTRQLGLRMRAATARRSPSSSRPSADELGLGEHAAAHRVLRREPHDGRGGRRVVRRLRSGGPDQERLPALQPRGRRRPATTTAGMRQAVRATLSRASQRGEAPMPDLLLIDGGPGQLQRGARRRSRDSACRTSRRRRRRERRRPPGRAGAHCSWPVRSSRLYSPPDSPALHLIQRDPRRSASLRDHRASAVARQDAARIVARGNPGPRPQATPGAAQGVRRAAGRAAGVGRGPREGARHQPAARAGDLRTHESGILTRAVNLRRSAERPDRRRASSRCRSSSCCSTGAARGRIRWPRVVFIAGGDHRLRSTATWRASSASRRRSANSSTRSPTS